MLRFEDLSLLQGGYRDNQGQRRQGNRGGRTDENTVNTTPDPDLMTMMCFLYTYIYKYI